MRWIAGLTVALTVMTTTAACSKDPAPAFAARLQIPNANLSDGMAATGSPVAFPEATAHAEPLPPWTATAAPSRDPQIGPRYIDTGRSTGAIAARPGAIAMGGRLALVTRPQPRPGGFFWNGPDDTTDSVLLVDAASGTPLPVQPKAPWQGPGWPTMSMDGRFVTYTTSASGGNRIVLWDADAGDFVALPGLERTTGRDPAVDALGERLIFVGGTEAAPRLFLYHRGAALVTDVPLPEALLAGARTPVLSGDGRTAAFVSASARGDANVVVVDVYGGRPLTPSALNSADQERDPALDATGRRLLFASDRNGSFDVYGYDLDRDETWDPGAPNTWADETMPRFCGFGALALVSNVEGAPVAYVRALAPTN